MNRVLNKLFAQVRRDKCLELAIGATLVRRDRRMASLSSVGSMVNKSSDTVVRCWTSRGPVVDPWKSFVVSEGKSIGVSKDRCFPFGRSAVTGPLDLESVNISAPWRDRDQSLVVQSVVECWSIVVRRLNHCQLCIVLSLIRSRIHSVLHRPFVVRRRVGLDVACRFNGPDVEPGSTLSFTSIVYLAEYSGEFLIHLEILCVSRTFRNVCLHIVRETPILRGWEVFEFILELGKTR